MYQRKKTHGQGRGAIVRGVGLATFVQFLQLITQI